MLISSTKYNSRMQGGGGGLSNKLNSLIKRELHPTTFSPLLSTTALALILSACGGGGGGGGSSTNSATSASTTISGRLFDGPISGAKIYIDMNGDGTINEGDLHVDTTDSNGAYEIPNAHANKKLIADLTNATDIDDPNTALTGTYRAPAGSKVISPLTHYLEVTGNVAGLGLKEKDIKTRDPFRDGTKDGTDKAIEVTARLVAGIIKTTADSAALKTATEVAIASANTLPTAMDMDIITDTVAEGPSAEIHLATFTFTDDDGLGPLNVSPKSTSRFEVRETDNRLVKELWMKTGFELDYENSAHRTINLALTSLENGNLPARTFTLNVTNLNDEAPDLRKTSDSGDLRTGETDTNLTFTLTDADGGEVKADGFKISSDDSPDQSSKFEIRAVDNDTDLTDGKSYKIFAKANQTFGDTPITLKVTYSDGVNARDEITFTPFTPTAALTTPDIAGGPTAAYEIDEDDDNNSIDVATLSASGGGIAWSIDRTNATTGGPDRANFSITSDGALTFTGPSNQDANNSQATHTVIVTATNTAQTGGTTDTQTITVTIVNIDEGDAVFAISGMPRAGQSLIASLTTADPDGVTNAGYSYQWYRTDKDGNTSQIQNATNVTYRLTTADEDHTISVKITYRDKSVTGQTTDTVVTSTPSAKIPITPVITTTDTTPAIDENDTSTSIVVPVGLDLENDTPVTWSVSDTTNFAIDANGTLTFIGSSNQDVTSPTSSYAVTITATSTADNILTDTVDITLTINDTNDEDHHLTLGGNAGDLRTGTVPINTDTGLTFTFQDADNTIDESLFSISSDDFKVVAANSNAIKDGRLYKIQTSAEKTFTATAINLTVTYDDSMRPIKTVTFAEFTPTAAVTTPDIAGGATATYTIDEDDDKDADNDNNPLNNNARDDILVATLSADGGAIAWSIIRTSATTGGADRAHFKIHGTTGQLYFVGKSDQDANDSKDEYTVIVTATNTAGSDTQTITVTIEDINDEIPVLDKIGTTSTLIAGADTNDRDTGLTFTVTDADKMFDHDGFTITGDQNSKFDIEHVSTTDAVATYKIIAKATQDITPTGITLTIGYNDGENIVANADRISYTFTPTIPAAKTYTATAANQTFTGSPYNDDDLVSFAGSTAVNINLGSDSHSGGFAQGVTLTSIEHIIGSPQADTITGNAKDNIIEGGAGGDRIDGGAGNDTISFENAGSTTGLNIVLFHAALGRGVGLFGDANGDSYFSIENVIGSAAGDVIEGTADDNILEGGDGTDRVAGRGGNDTLIGGNGVDRLEGGTGNDTYVLGARGEGRDLVQDFTHTVGNLDKIRVDITGTAADIAAIRTALNLRITNDTEINDHADITSNPSTNDENTNDTIIYDTNSTSSDTSDDQILMVLLDFTETLTIDMFDII